MTSLHYEVTYKKSDV